MLLLDVYVANLLRLLIRLFSFFFLKAPQVFEEDTRMSADLNLSNQSMTSMEPPLTPQK